MAPHETNQAKTSHDPVMSALYAIPNRILLSTAGFEIGMWDEAQTVGSTCGLRLGGIHPDLCRRALKRAFDILFASLVLLCGLPLLAVIVIAIRLSSPGSIFYGQERVGRRGRPFNAWKFRTMHENADAVLESYLASDPALRAEWETSHKLRNDPRITPIGRFLRKTSLDELPQLWNVLKGEMAVVGPRPIVNSATYDRTYVVDYPHEYAVYTTVRPGLTGLWQVTCRNNGVYEMRIFWDMYYIRNWSLWFDAYIVLRTIRTVLLGEGAA